MSMHPFTDRRYNLGDEKKYLIRKQDGTAEIVDLEKVGIVEEGSRINAAALNPIVTHVNDPNIHVSRGEIDALEARAQAKLDALAGEGNTKTVKQLDDEVQGVAANQGVISDTVTGKKYKFGMENGLVFLEVVGG